MSDQQAILRSADCGPVVLGNSIPYDVHCIQSGGERLWIDPPEAPSEEGKNRVFYTHAPEGREEVFRADEILLGEEDIRLIYSGKNPQKCFQREGYPKEELMPAGETLGIGKGKSVEITPISDGERIFIGKCEAQCIHTPGPTPGHTCLYLPQEQTLFAGELLSQPPRMRGIEQDTHMLEKLLKSLEQIKELPVQKVFPGWRGTDTLPERADQIIRNCYFRLLELLRLVQDHPGLTAYELAARFSRQETAWADMPMEQKREAMEETLSYLSYLREREYVRAVVEGDVRVNVPGRRRLTDVV